MSKLPPIDPRQPVALAPVAIPKPWGQEIWYTGMESRGESQVVIDGTSLPLSEYLAHNPDRLANRAPVLLLKILDPKPEAVLGDLYFEVHEEKQEVYVVTHVDPGAWPNGEGGIRLGMCQAKRADYADAQSFRAAYLETVRAYEHIRRQIDEHNAAIDPAEERAARAAMDAFAAQRKLRVGDVVRVPTWTPHSLLHGVRVVEFQTPTYERYIISFAQQVLTQDHWDSAYAIAHMHVDAPAPEIFEQVQTGVERVAEFTDFNVWRVDLAAAETLRLPTQIPYAVCMTVTGEARVGALTMSPEQACFIPYAAVEETELSGFGQLLIAAPDL